MKLYKLVLILVFLGHWSIAATLDKVAIQVNNGVILESEIQNMIKVVTANAKRDGQALPSAQILREKVIERLIAVKLQLEMAKKVGLNISDIQLDRAIDNIASEQKISVEKLKQLIEEQGSSFEQYREEVRRQITLNEIERMELSNKVNISHQEVSNLTKLIKDQGPNPQTASYNIGHILIGLPDNPSTAQIATATAKIKSVMDALKNGTNFKKVAMEYSNGPKALEGGQWGFMTLSEMPTLFAEVISKGAHKGQILGPFKSSLGFHIIMILDTKDDVKVNITEVKSRHILLRPSPILSEERAKAMLEQFVTEIRAGRADFASLAKKYSEDPGSAVNGGELGWADPSLYVPEFKAKVLSLKVNEVSEPFRSSEGWHVVQLEDKRTVDATKSFDENRAYQLIYRRKFNEELEKWLNDLKHDAYIRVLDQNQ